jgi:hypothetical protein
MINHKYNQIIKNFILILIIRLIMILLIPILVGNLINKKIPPLNWFHYIRISIWDLPNCWDIFVGGHKVME